MSRVGKLPVTIPEGVTVDIAADTIKVKGKLGELTIQNSELVNTKIVDNAVVVAPANDTKESRALWGTYRSLVNNMVQGVTEGYNIRLVVNGVGYRAAVNGNLLSLTLGFSHEIIYAIPEGINIKCEKQTLLIISLLISNWLVKLLVS